MVAGLLVLVFVFGIMMGARADCDLQLWNPVVYWQTLGALQRAPWTWGMQNLGQALAETRSELLMGTLVCAATTAAFAYGGPNAALAALQLSTSATGSSLGGRVLGFAAGKYGDQHYDDGATARDGIQRRPRTQRQLAHSTEPHNDTLLALDSQRRGTQVVEILPSGQQLLVSRRE